MFHLHRLGLVGPDPAGVVDQMLRALGQRHRAGTRVAVDARELRVRREAGEDPCPGLDPVKGPLGDGFEAVRVGQLTGARLLVTGSVVPLHASALGKVLLAFDPGAARSVVHQPLAALTNRTIMMEYQEHLPNVSISAAGKEKAEAAAAKQAAATQQAAANVAIGHGAQQHAGIVDD